MPAPSGSTAVWPGKPSTGTGAGFKKFFEDLWAEVTALWAKVNDDTGWVTLTVAGGWTVNNTVQIRRIGAVVYYRGRVTGTVGTTATSLVAVGGVPAGSRPPGTFNNSPCPLATSTGANDVLATAGTDGSISLQAPTSASRSVWLTGMQYLAS